MTISTAHPNLKYTRPPQQFPLILVVHEDDEFLYNSPDNEWYRILKDLPDFDYIELAADYYNSLNHFNKTDEHVACANAENETKDEGKQRLLSERATMNDSQPVLYEQPIISGVEMIVRPTEIAPGITPKQMGGKPHKCFFALFKSFIGAPLMGLPAEPDKVHQLLTSNPQFARVCGFTPTNEKGEYNSKNIPSLRKLQQFDQIMTDYGLWDKCKHNEIVQNIEQEVIKKEQVIVGDTTHYYAFSEYETVTYRDEKGSEKKKSQSKTTKKCRCGDQCNCSHEWELADDGAGTIVKNKTKFIWGHKASILGLPLQGIPLDARAVADAATFDGKTFLPHMIQFFEQYPFARDWIDIALYDSACDAQELKDDFKKELGIELKTSLNPRRKQAVTQGLPKGMNHLTPFGNLKCEAGYDMEYKGARYKAEVFIYSAPIEDDVPACLGCKHKATCCPNAGKGRTVQIPFEKLPHIDHEDPPMAKRYKAMMTQRPSIERMIKRLKCDLGDDRLKKRGNASFQAYLDKTMVAFHILLRN